MDDTSPAPAVLTKADAARRAQQAAELRVAGVSWAEVAATLGYAHETNAARAVRQHFGSVPHPDRAEAKEVLRRRAEWLWQRAREDVEQGRPGAVRSAVALLQRVALLDGLDAPTQVQVTPSAEAFEAGVQLLLRMHQQEQGVLEEVDVFEE